MVASAALLLVGLAGPAAADDTKQPFVTQKSPPNSPSVEECTATGDPTADLLLDCDDPFPNNEPNVVVNPADPLHMVASSNDYGSCCDQYYTTFDGGRTWRTGNMSRRGPNVIGSDPTTPFYGRTYVTWTGFVGDAKRTLASPIVIAWSDDGGLTWSQPKIISGSNPRYCTFQTSGPAGECDEDQFSAPRVGPGGVLHVAFQNGQHEAAWEPGEQFESQYLVVTSRDGGATFSDPVHVVDQEDGSRDFPLNVDGRQTLTGLQVRVPTGGTMAVDPSTGRLYLTFTDNRAGIHDIAEPVTNAKAYIVTSADGVTWSAPVAVDTSDTESWFFQAGVPGCETCATFHGDYLGLDYGSDGVANLAWTDMRDKDPATGLYRQFIYFARR